MRLFPDKSRSLDQLDPSSLERGLDTLVAHYQKRRSTMIALFVAHYAEVLSDHPEFEGSDKDRCAWRRTSSHRQWLARFGTGRSQRIRNARSDA